MLPVDDGWETARQAWNLVVEQRPVAVVLPESAEDVVATVAFAAENGLRIAFNGGGHSAGPIGTSSNAGVIGYTLGGGFSWMIRKYGLAATSVEAVELATADGRHVRADKDHDPIPPAD